MNLFQSSVLKKYLSAQDHDRIQKGYDAFKAYFQNETHQKNIRASKEEQFQQKFLIELFVNIFGYTMNPDEGFNITTELKNIGDAKKTDGAILQGDDALAVIELKGTNTRDLSKVTEQAFNYKNNQPSCVYVITSNFEKLRFYIHNAVDYEEFNLFTLSQERFNLLWLLLHEKNLLKGIPEKIKNESLLEEEKVTKRLYKDYSEFKNDLWEDMCRNNPKVDELELYKKSQKLLDRFLFIFFAEDKGLLPPNSISVIVEDWKKLKDLDAYKPLFSRFQKYFGYLNDGYKGKRYEIHAYNGGLFKADPLLDDLIITDEVLEKHVSRLTEYDFETEVDTNILGHIFEHSLNDIENVRAQLAGEELDKSKSKRKKDGVFYTPKYITKYIVDNTVGKLCEEKKAELGLDEEEFAKDRKGRRKDTLKKLDDQLRQYRDWLLQLTICDPACGSGAFLNQALEFLITEHRYVDELESQLLGYAMVFPDVENHILEKNIYGLDINEESVEIARLSLWLRTAKKGRKLTSLSRNIQVGNSLIDDPEFAGELAFNWVERFPKVFEKGGFNIVIGNPPYVSFSNGQQSFFEGGYKTAKCGDLYTLFYELGIRIMKENGRMGYITPSSFLTNIGFFTLRAYLIDFRIEIIIDHGSNVFKDAAVDSTTVILKKETVEDCTIRCSSDGVSFNDVESRLFRELDDQVFNIYVRPKELRLANEIMKKSSSFDMHVTFSRGVEFGFKSQFILDIPTSSSMKPIVCGGDISRNAIRFQDKFVEHDDANPKIYKSSRIYSEPKILLRRIGNEITSCFDNNGYWNVCDVYNLQKKEDGAFPLKTIAAVINSKLIDFIYRNKFKSVKKLFPKIPIQNLKKLPLPKESNQYADLLQDLQEQALLCRQEYMTLTMGLLDVLESRFSLVRVSKKLDNWAELDFKEFKKELVKNKVTLSLEEEAEWMVFFNKKKAESSTLKAEIDRLDREIDQMVYELYGLNDEEIAIIENS